MLNPLRKKGSERLVTEPPKMTLPVSRSAAQFIVMLHNIESTVLTVEQSFERIGVIDIHRSDDKLF